MKVQLFIFLLLLDAAGPVRAQYLSLQDLLEFAEQDPEGHFQEDFRYGFKALKSLRSKGFSGVRWRLEDPDLEENVGSYKLYARATNAYLIFHADAHNRLLEELIYRVSNPACVVQLKRQLVAAGFTNNRRRRPPPLEDPNFPAPRFSAYDCSFSNARYSITITGEVGLEGQELYRYSVTISRDAAMQEMYDEIEGSYYKAARPKEKVKQRPKPH